MEIIRDILEARRGGLSHQRPLLLSFILPSLHTYDEMRWITALMTAMQMQITLWSKHLHPHPLLFCFVLFFNPSTSRTTNYHLWLRRMLARTPLFLGWQRTLGKYRRETERDMLHLEDTVNSSFLLCTRISFQLLNTDQVLSCVTNQSINCRNV